MPKKERVTPGLGIAPTPARPSEGARDTFVQFTGNAASQPLRQLASSLSRFGEQGSRYASTLQKKQQEEDSEAGRTAFLKALEEQKDTAKALASLKMRPQQSKWFRWGVQSAAGKADALRARDYLYANYADELEEAELLEEYDALAAKALEEYRGDTVTTEAFDNGFFPGYIAVMENGRYEFARGLDGKLSKQRLEAFELTNLSEMGGWIAREQPRVDLAAAITTQLDAVGDPNSGENPLIYTEMQETVVQNLKALAASNDDISIIEIAKEIKIGPETDGYRASLWDRFRGGSDGLENAQSSVLQAQGTRRAAEEAQREYMQEKERRALEQELGVYLIQGGRGGENIRPIEDIIAAGWAVSSSVGMNLQQQVDNREAFVDSTIQGTYDSIQSDIWSGEGSIGQILNSRSQLSQADANNLLGQLRQYEAENDENDGDDTKSLLKDSRFTSYVTGLGQAFGEGTIEYTEDKGNRLRSARARLRREIAQNSDTLRQMTEVEQQEWMEMHSNAAADFYKGRLQAALEGGGLEEMPVRPLYRATQTELESDFSVYYDKDVSNWAKVYGLDFSGAEQASGFNSFRQAWDTARPDAPVGSPMFLTEWTNYKQNRDGTTHGTINTGEAN